jgi:succinyl-diaminopimelate desuccinylase
LVFENNVSEKGLPKRGKRRTRTANAVAMQTAEAKSFTHVKDAVTDFCTRTGYDIRYKGRGRSVEISAYGVAAHGAHPEDGCNAISLLMAFLCELPLANEGAREFVDFYQTHIAFETDGKGLGIAAHDDLSGRLIVNVGQIALGREAAILTVNVRNPVTKKEEDVYDDLRSLIDRYGIGVVRVSGMAPLFFPADDPLVETLMDVYRTNTGDQESLPIVIGGGTYARSFPRAVAFGPRFPGEEDVMHQKDEYIREDSLFMAAQIYTDAIRRLAE